MKVCRQWEEKKSPKTLIMIFPDYLDAVDRAFSVEKEVCSHWRARRNKLMRMI